MTAIPTASEQAALSDESEVVEAPPAPEDASHWRREHFIPLRKADLARLIASDGELLPGDSENLAQLCRMLESTLHYEFQEQLRELKNAYAPFDPDRDTLQIATIADAERDELAARLFDNFADLLVRANFQKLSQSEIEDCVGAASDWGLRLYVDFSVFERLDVYSRGDIIGRRARRHWRKLYREEEVDVPLYQRLAVVFRLRPHKRLGKLADPHTVHLKIFKNIPKADVDMLLPGSQVRLSLFDQGKIWLPTLSGLGLTAVKVFKGAMLAALTGLFTGIWGILAFIGLVGGTLGYGVKSILGYLRTKDKYQLNLTRSLYFQNLDNNAGVIYRLLDEAEEQEFREALLAYFLLWRKATQPWSAERLDREAETYLKRVLEVDVDFEVSDALAKLKRWGLAEEITPDNWRAKPIETALAGLDQTWDSYFRHHQPAGGQD